MDANAYSRWLAAQEWLDEVERDARLGYWLREMDQRNRLKALLDAVAGEDQDERR